MLNSRLAGIPISSSTIDEAGVPQLSICGEQTAEPSTGSGGRLHFGMVAGFISEWWPTSNRNPRPDCLGIRSVAGTTEVGSIALVEVGRPERHTHRRRYRGGDPWVEGSAQR